MEPFVLKIATITCFMGLSENAPLEQYRTTLAEWTDYNTFEPQGPGTYSFGYDIEDPEKDNVQFRDEERFPNGTVRGSYGYLRPDGMVQIVHYTADKDGYRAKFESYPRGQLKPSWETSGITEEPLSSALRSAIRSKNVYKRQHVQEQRFRPADIQSPPNIELLSSSTHNSNKDYNTDPSAYSNNYHNNYSTYVNPYQLLVKNG